MKHALLLLLSLAACTEVVSPWDDEPTPPDEVQGDDDDSTSPGEPALNLEPSQVLAGSVVDVELQLESFAFGGETTPCCGTGNVVVLGPGSSARHLSMFFGLHAQGEEPWGLAGPSAQVTDTFAVEAAPTPASLELGTGSRQVSVDERGGYVAWELAVAKPGQALAARVRDPVAPFFRPRLWVLADDGVTRLGEGGQAVLGGDYAPPSLLAPVEAGTVYLRVDDADGDGGAGYAGTLDAMLVPWPDPVDVPEIETNDVAPQGLGELRSGRVHVHGVAATQGHDELDEPNGDRDLFAFTVAHDSTVTFTLQWEDPGNDFDAVLYDNRGGDALIAFDSPDAIALDTMASLGFPEVGEYHLEAGVEYVLMVVNWFGVDGLPYTLDLEVLGDPWAEADAEAQ